MYQDNYMFMLSQATYSKVFEFISNNKHQRTSSLWGDTSTQNWFTILSVSQDALLLSPSIQSENDFQIENVDGMTASGEILQQSLMARAYPIIMVDAKAFPLLQWDFKALNDKVEIIKITHDTEDQQYAGQYYTSVNLSELEKNYQTLLPKLWNDYTTEKTATKVLKNGLI